VDVLPAVESTLPSGQAEVASIEHALVGGPGIVGVGGDGASLLDFDHTVPTPDHVAVGRASGPRSSSGVARFSAVIQASMRSHQS
jgi:hypothetical protein